MLTISNDTLNLATRRWEDTRDLLSNALKSYLDSCTSLETTLGLGCDPLSAKDIASRIDSTLDSLQRDMTQQLAQSTSALARARNRLAIAPSIWRLPEEVLSKIFLHVVHAPANKDQSMKKCLSAMYSSLHCLVAVCSTWRNLVLTQGVFWEIIPACDEPIKYRSIELGIQRAGDRGLHLAMTIPGADIPRLMTIIDKHTSRLRALNVESESYLKSNDLIRQLFRDNAPSQLSELSICHATTRYHPDECKSSFVLCPQSLDQPPFTRLIQSLSVLRLSRFTVRWKYVTFSDRLVELFIHRVRLRNSGSAVATLLSAISSASELRDLKIIDVQACRNSAETTDLMGRPKIALPKLQSLVLQDLWFNVLELFLLVIAPGSHHLTLGLTSRAVQIVHLYDTSGVHHYRSEKVELDDLIALLSRANFDRLFLAGDRGNVVNNIWLDGPGLRKLLASVPCLKELGMHDWNFDEDFCTWRFTISTSTSDIKRGQFTFPSPEVLELTEVMITDEKGFKRLLVNSSIQRMVLGGTILAGVRREWAPLKGEDDIIGWLESNLPSFRLVPPRYIPTWMRVGEWRLW